MTDPEPTDPSPGPASAPVSDGAPFDVSAVGDRPVPRLYLASPLTGLSESRRRELSLRIRVVKSAVVDVTMTERPDEEQWPVSVYAPWEHTSPWGAAGLSPQTIYDHNLDHLLDCDGLVIVTDGTCSAGIGQEIEWAVRSGIPILYLSDTEASRQIRGTPHSIAERTWTDAETMAAHVRNWLSVERAQLQNGPRRRVDRDLAYVKVTAQLEVAWKSAANPTAIAAQLGLHPDAVWSLIKSPARVALTPWWTVCELAAELGVSLEARRALTFLESRAWTKAAEDGSWTSKAAERSRAHAVGYQAADLELPATWAALYRQLAGDDGGPPAS
ncbi:MAG: hypothetical protein DLM56_14780 [Pseudonocardiales bacterium]|nr:MAG: hypothetical protein DLM56_14780 [Pseudonocardiales bacterium]